MDDKENLSPSLYCTIYWDTLIYKCTLHLQPQALEIMELPCQSLYWLNKCSHQIFSCSPFVF